MQPMPDSSAKPAVPPAPAPLDLAAVKSRQRVMWGSGDYAVIGTMLQIVGETLCEAADLAAGSRVLDVACGNGNATLAAARRFCVTTGVDYTPSLLERGRERARAEGLAADFVEGDAEALPFAEGAFDAVLSTFGVMFAPNQERAASELVRVCAPGGRIALANWTPDSFVGDLLRAVTKRVPPPPGLASPLAWGTDDGIARLFGNRVRVVSSERREFVFRYRSGAHFIDVFRAYYGPTYQAFRALDEQAQKALAADIATAFARRDRGVENSKVPSEYLEVVLEKL